MGGGEYNVKMKEAIFKIGAQSVEKNPNEIFMEKREVLDKNGA